MRILLQQKDTALYVKGAGAWTNLSSEAMDFVSSSKAIAFSRLHKINDVQLVLKFEEQLYDIVLPMARSGRYQNLRSNRV